MKKIDLIKMWQTRAYNDEKKYTQYELNDLLNALIDAVNDAFEFTLDNNESVSLGSGVRLVVKYTPERKYSERTLKNISTGEPIVIPSGVKPAKRKLVIEGFEKEV